MCVDASLPRKSVRRLMLVHIWLTAVGMGSLTYVHCMLEGLIRTKLQHVHCITQSHGKHDIGAVERCSAIYMGIQRAFGHFNQY